ncbi:hypothetical protein CRENPOLYSF1_620007 [Crenothrix polyspora]|uniref:Uncharacterized protein n=1 Tax=Crenothrix polyspora TaxID=360316 RepID=A0A1R4HFM1_9GAMM|nr:hypothetical protein CRENPOLYSF1_620007 [Crenothrix polyspora]
MREIRIDYHQLLSHKTIPNIPTIKTAPHWIFPFSDCACQYPNVSALDCCQ